MAIRNICVTDLNENDNILCDVLECGQAAIIHVEFEHSTEGHIVENYCIDCGPILKKYLFDPELSEYWQPKNNT